MGVAADLSYVLAPPTAVQRAVRSAAATRPVATSLARALPTLDRAVGRLTGGRTTACALLSGLPVVVLTTTGRRSGERRSTQLIGVPVGDTLALLGTNFGRSRTPAWVLRYLTRVPHRRVRILLLENATGATT